MAIDRRAIIIMTMFMAVLALMLAAVFDAGGFGIHRIALMNLRINRARRGIDRSRRCIDRALINRTRRCVDRLLRVNGLWLCIDRLRGVN